MDDTKEWNAIKHTFHPLRAASFFIVIYDFLASDIHNHLEIVYALLHESHFLFITVFFVECNPFA